MTKGEARIIIQSAVMSARECGVDIDKLVEILQTIKVHLCEHKEHLTLQQGEANDVR